MKPIIELEDDDNSQRENFRIKPHPKDPVKMKVAGVDVIIVDISAKGVAFTFNEDIKGKLLPFKLGFKTDKVYVVSGKVNVVRKNGTEYSGQFEEIDEKDTAHIASLIVECQKRDIRRRKEQELEKREENEK